MSSAADPCSIVGVNWGSSALRAYLIDAGGAAVDEVAEAVGVVGLDRAGMAAKLAALHARWPNVAGFYLSGMIGSNVGWAEVPYVSAPAAAADIASAATRTQVGAVAVTILPGVACRRDADAMPDIMRGEEVELAGLMTLSGSAPVAAMPGTHTKWVALESGLIGDFFTSMSGEIFDRLTAQGLLASIVEGEAVDGPAFRRGVAAGACDGFGLGTLLFGARALVIRGELSRAEAASYIRGCLIGTEVADAARVFPDLAQAPVPLVGNAALSRLYASALAQRGFAAELVDPRLACLAGFRAIHAATHG